MKNGIFTTVEDTELRGLLSRLKEAGFSDSHISVLVPHSTEPKDLSLQQDVRHGAVTGGIVGILAAEFSTVGTLMLAGVGSFLVAGPLLIALSGAAVGGAAVGGVIGGLAAGTGYFAKIVGIPKSVVDQCETELKQRRGLVLVEYDSEAEKRHAWKVFTDAGVSRIYETEGARESGAA